MKKYTYEKIKDALQNNTALLINFTKVDGTSRALHATLKSDLIPEDHQPKGEKKLNLKEDTVRVYDIENKGWRSFRVDSVTSIETL
jgi:hypothetical protein